MNEKKVKEVVKPEVVKLEHMEYIDVLWETGTNMFGATPYLMEEYPELSEKEAEEILKYWMDTF